MRTEKKAKKAAEKWISQTPVDSVELFKPLKQAFIAGYMSEEEITPGPWKANPGHQPEESMRKRIDVRCLDAGLILNADADYQDWTAKAVLDEIVEWRLHDE